MKSAMKTMMGVGLAAALALVVGQAWADESTPAASDDGASTPAMASDESAAPASASAEEVGAGGAEPGRMSDAMAQDSTRARDQQLNHDEWLHSIWYGP